MNDWQALEVEATGAKNGLCECCKTETQHHWGFVHFDNSTIASYFVKWTKKRPDHGAWFDLLIGEWGKHGNPAKRTHIALEFLLIDGKPNFIVRNSEDANQDYSSVAINGSLRDEIIGTGSASHIFAITDAIYMSDKVQEIRGWSH